MSVLRSYRDSKCSFFLRTDFYQFFLVYTHTHTINAEVFLEVSFSVCVKAKPKYFHLEYRSSQDAVAMEIEIAGNKSFIVVLKSCSTCTVT